MVLPEIIQVKMPPIIKKAFGPPTTPHAMTTPVLTARLMSLVQTTLTSLLQRISQTYAPSPIAPEIDTPPWVSPAWCSSPSVFLGTKDSPILHTNVTTTLGKRKEGPAQEDDTTTEKVLTQAISNPKNPVTSRPAPQPASPLWDHHWPTHPIQIIEQIPTKEKDFPMTTGLLPVSGPVSPFSILLFSNHFLSRAIIAKRWLTSFVR